MFDALSASLAWTLFYVYRKYFIEPDKFGYKIPVEIGNNFYLALVIIPFFWFCLYFLSGYYKNVWGKSRINEISSTFSVTIIGVVFLFFSLLLDDEVSSYEAYYNTFIALFFLHFSITLTQRLAVASYIITQFRKKKIGFNTIVIGNNKNTLSLISEIKDNRNAQGFILKGYVSVNETPDKHILNQSLTYLGTYERLPQLISEHDIEEVIIGIESSKHVEINKVTNVLEQEKVRLKIIPDLFDMMSGAVRMHNVIGPALIEINHDTIPTWQIFLKRVIDFVASALVLFILSPLFLVLAILVKLSSPGHVFFKQIRLGYKGKPFYIYKFRTMYVDSENEGPKLSSKNDSRVTKIGKWLRRYRLDELPQFYNVLTGVMSLVGPRPERKFFVDQIVKIAPHYKHLHRVKPGITSWGQVKYGYAENVDQMVERLKFDILYIENRSIAVDFRILIYTVITILQGRGR